MSGSSTLLRLGLFPLIAEGLVLGIWKPLPRVDVLSNLGPWPRFELHLLRLRTSRPPKVRAVPLYHGEPHCIGVNSQIIIPVRGLRKPQPSQDKGSFVTLTQSEGCHLQITPRYACR